MPTPRPRVFIREFKEAAVQRIAAGEKVRWPKLSYDWWQLYERGGPEALRAPGRPRASAAGEHPRVVRDSPRGRRAHQGRAVGAAAEPGGSRVAELERKIGQQAVELDFFARALRHIKASAPPSDGRGARAPGGDRPRSALGPGHTYLRLLEEFAFLAIVLDAFSRRVIGWALELHLRASLALAALQMALTARRPPPGTRSTTPIGACNTPAPSTRRSWPSTGSSRA